MYLAAASQRYFAALHAADSPQASAAAALPRFLFAGHRAAVLPHACEFVYIRVQVYTYMYENVYTHVYI